MSYSHGVKQYVPCPFVVDLSVTRHSEFSAPVAKHRANRAVANESISFSLIILLLGLLIIPELNLYFEVIAKHKLLPKHDSITL